MIDFQHVRPKLCERHKPEDQMKCQTDQEKTGPRYAWSKMNRIQPTEYGCGVELVSTGCGIGAERQLALAAATGHTHAHTPALAGPTHANQAGVVLMRAADRTNQTNTNKSFRSSCALSQDSTTPRTVLQRAVLATIRQTDRPLHMFYYTRC